MPTGTVTFLFTDIQGSTRLWQDHPREMKTALARHDALLREAIESNHGSVFKTVGDAFCAAFATAMDGVQAALAAQFALQAEAWPSATPILARMALHTGEAEERDGDFFGPALNRASRLLSIGHGRQTLLSLVTAELVRDTLPEGVSLREMGEQRLKDLTRPESVYQLQHAELPADFPALHSLDSHPHNLPVEATPLIGREKELAAVERLITEGARVLTLTGPGGMGKTRLALQAAADLIENFRHGVFFVDLSPLDDPALVPARIAQALRLQESGPHPLLEQLKEFLCQKQILLVLDNFEQVLEAALQVVDLLASCPNVRFLVTSREALRVRGEKVFLVPPLSLPEARTRPAQSAAALGQYEAVRLFIERAVAVKPDFQVTNANAPAVAEICVRLEGIPLAIELAAARVRLLPPEMLLGKLASRLTLLRGGSRDLPPRQRTLRATIEWSYRLIEPPQQQALELLSVFAGGFTCAAAETLLAQLLGPDLDALGELETLADKSLLTARQEGSGNPRFHMLESIREYCHEKLAERQAIEEANRAHAAYFVRLTEATERRCFGPEPRECLDELELEHDNLREAARWAAGAGEVDTLLRLTGNLARFWQLRGHLAEGRELLRVAMELGGDAPGSLLVPALLGAGILAREQGDLPKALEYLEQARDMQRVNPGSIGMICHELGWTFFRQNELDKAWVAFAEAIRGAEAAGERLLISMCILGQGAVEWRRQHGASARDLLLRARELFRELNAPRLEAQALNNLGLVTRQEGDLRGAGEHYLQALSILKSIGDLAGQRTMLNNLGDISLRRGEFQAGLQHYEQLARLAGDLHDPRFLSTAYSGMAEAHLAMQEIVEAGRRIREALHAIEDLGDSAELGFVLSLMGRIEAQLQEYPEATAHLKRAITLLSSAEEKDEEERARRVLASIQTQLQGSGGGA